MFGEPVLEAVDLVEVVESVSRSALSTELVTLLLVPSPFTRMPTASKSKRALLYHCCGLRGEAQADFGFSRQLQAKFRTLNFCLPD